MAAKNGQNVVEVPIRKLITDQENAECKAAGKVAARCAGNRRPLAVISARPCENKTKNVPTAIKGEKGEKSDTPEKISKSNDVKKPEIDQSSGLEVKEGKKDDVKEDVEVDIKEDIQVEIKVDVKVYVPVEDKEDSSVDVKVEVKEDAKENIKEDLKEDVREDVLTSDDKNFEIKVDCMEDTPSEKPPTIEIINEKKIDKENMTIDSMDTLVTSETLPSEDQENITRDSSISDLSQMTIDTAEHKHELCFDQMLEFIGSEYDEDIQLYLMKQQEATRPDANYMLRHKNEINGKMRTILVDWMAEVVAEYLMNSETLFLAVNMVDRFLSVMGIKKASFQLLGTTALFVSSKYEEIYPPDISEFVYITDYAYTKNQILAMERSLLKTLKFDISPPTIHYFLRKHLSTVGLAMGLPQIVGIMAEYLCYLSLLECDPCTKYLPNDIAVSAIVVAANVFGISLTVDGERRRNFFPGLNNEELKNHFQGLQGCVDRLYSLRKESLIRNRDEAGDQQAVFRKYSQEKYFSVALIDTGDEPPKLSF